MTFSVLGGGGGSAEVSGTVVDLLDAVPYLFAAQLIPPWHVLNDLLRKGVADAGMSGGCTWESFELTRLEWAELSAHLQAANREQQFTFVEPPDWVQSIEEWNDWTVMVSLGLPDEFRTLSRRSREMDRALKKASEDGNTGLVEQLHLRRVEADTELASLVMEHRRKGTSS